MIILTGKKDLFLTFIYTFFLCGAQILIMCTAKKQGNIYLQKCVCKNCTQDARNNRLTRIFYEYLCAS